MAAVAWPPSVAVIQRREEGVVMDPHVVRRPGQAGSRLAASRWNEYVAARERFLALLAAQSVAWAAARRLPGEADRGYDRAPADRGREARLQ
jgi:hypothetical protein